MDDESSIRRKFESLKGVMDERWTRLWAAAEAEALGRGGVAAVVRATGLSKRRILAGVAELRGDVPADVDRVRRPGAGRPRATSTDPKLVKAIESLVHPSTRGDPQSPLRWTAKSTRTLAEELTASGHAVSDRTVADLLQRMGYSLQATRKVREGGTHPDRNAQFAYINERVRAFHRRRQPVVSVDTKKKELVGDYKNAGQEWRPAKKPVPVRVYDFVDKELGKAIPYGVYDIFRNEGWVNVGVNHDTAEFAVESLRRWWRRMGCRVYPDARELLVTADGGGSNGSRCRLWKIDLQRFATESGLTVTVSHYPPGTSKWNRIEHRLFCHITHNWRGRPLESLETIVSLIGATTTRTGLRVRAALDKNVYEKGIKVTDDELGSVNIAPAKFHGEWNYTIKPEAISEAS